MELDHLVGVGGFAEGLVDASNTAIALGSGTLPVYATPALATLAEQAAVQALAPYLPLGMTSVGVALAVKHFAATPVGHNINAQARVTRVEGRRVELHVSIYDEREKVGDVTHERFVVEAEAFLAKVALKRPKT